MKTQYPSYIWLCSVCGTSYKLDSGIIIPIIETPTSEVPKKCPNCNEPLVERSGKFGSFLGCKNFPHCRYTFSLGGQSYGENNG